MGEGSRGLGRNQRGLRVGCCEMVGDYYDDSSVKENLNLLLRLTRIEANVDSDERQGFLEGRLQGTRGRGGFEGLLQRAEVLGASAASLSNDRLRKTFQGFTKERTLKSSTVTQRDPGRTE